MEEGVSISPVRTRKDKRKFVHFPLRLYRGNKNWCPPLLREHEKMLNQRRHPFFGHGIADFFLARDSNGEVQGRIAVSEDPRYHERHGDRIGCFGMFECVDDQTVANALLDQASEWCRSRGVSAILGPIDYSTNYQVGLLIEGFDLPQRIMMNYHLPYYQDLIEQWGGRKERDLVSWSTRDASKMRQWRKKIDRLERLSRVTVRAFNRAEMERDVKIVHDLSCAILGHQWGFVEPTAKEIEKLRRDLDPVPPDLILIAEDEGKPVGLVVNVPDYNEAIRPTGGRLVRWGLPVGMFRLLRGIKKIKCARMAILGVLPEYRFEGIAERLIVKSFETGRYRYGFSEAEMGWTLEGNDDLSRTVGKVAGPCSRRFRVYRKEVAQQAVQFI